MLISLLDFLIFGFRLHPKLKILDCVFMTTEDFGISWELLDPIEGIKHLVGTSFKESATPSKEESVPCKDASLYVLDMLILSFL